MHSPTECIQLVYKRFCVIMVQKLRVACTRNKIRTKLVSFLTVLGFGDLWLFNSTSLSWIWVSGSNEFNKEPFHGMKGQASDFNTPGARIGATMWCDSNHTLWLFGGQDRYENMYNDLWMYNIQEDSWIWVTGIIFIGFHSVIIIVSVRRAE